MPVNIIGLNKKAAVLLDTIATAATGRWNASYHTFPKDKMSSFSLE